ncbi:MAG: hypothetical protein LH616_08335 [Ilumatobacteraceae bacterium]|nr:hypothetical protein [Ilumatobacteraceae bacterium]
MRTSADRKVLGLAICSALWDYWEMHRAPKWFEGVYGWVDKWDVKESV